MAVYTSLIAKDIAGFLTRYDVGALASFHGIAEGVENTNYLLLTSRGKYILTLYEKRVSPADLPFYLGLTEHLADRGIPCPRPVKGWDGQTVRLLKGRPAALIHFLEGRNNPVITPRHMEPVGELIARMHYAAEGFPMTRRNALSLDGWWELFTGIRGRADEIAPGLEKTIADELAFLGAYWPSGLPSGIVHADIFPDNVFFLDDSPPKLSGIIDFYFACNDFWAYDLLICLNAWCFDEAYRFVPERARALLGAYVRLRPLTDAERRAVPVLARGAALRFLLTRAHDWLYHDSSVLVTPKDPKEYIAKLRFHRQSGIGSLIHDR